MNRRAFSTLLTATLIAPSGVVFAQDAATETLEISGAFSRASPKMAKAGAGFMTIRSKGPADRLLGFKTAACNRPELHTHLMDNGIMRMRKVDDIEVPAGGEAVLKPGSLHLMLIDLNVQLNEGEMIDVVLLFENAGEVPISMPIKKPGAMK